MVEGWSGTPSRPRRFNPVAPATQGAVVVARCLVVSLRLVARRSLRGSSLSIVGLLAGLVVDDLKGVVNVGLAHVWADSLFS